MKVLLASSKYAPEYSGSGYRAGNLYSRLKKKHKIKFHIFSNSKIYKRNIYKKNFTRIGRLFINTKKNKFLELVNIFNDIFYTWLFIKKNIKKFDLLHTFGNSYGLSFLTIYFGIKKKPIIREICNIISTPFYPIQFSYIINKIFLRKNTLLVSISPWLTKICEKYKYNLLWSRSNPIDEKKYYLNYSKKNYYRKKLTSFSKKDKVILFVSSFMAQKNHIFLVKLLKFLPSNYKLILGGPHQSKNEIKEYLKTVNLIKKFKFQKRAIIIDGFIDNFNEYLWASDVMAFPVSSDEGFGTPVVEAQACGIPVVSNKIKDLTDHYIKDGKGGFSSKLVLKTFAKKIEISTKIKKTYLKKNSLSFLNEISTKIIDKKYYNLINKILNEKNNTPY